jgi:hypothetical protein
MFQSVKTGIALFRTSDLRAGTMRKNYQYDADYLELRRAHMPTQLLKRSLVASMGLTLAVWIAVQVAHFNYPHSEAVFLGDSIFAG